MEIYIVIFTCFICFCECTRERFGSFQTCKQKRLSSQNGTHVSVRSRIQCADACLGEISCTAATFNKRTKLCQVHYGDVSSTCDAFHYDKSFTILLKTTSTPTETTSPTTKIAEQTTTPSTQAETTVHTTHTAEQTTTTSTPTVTTTVPTTEIAEQTSMTSTPAETTELTSETAEHTTMTSTPAETTAPTTETAEQTTTTSTPPVTSTVPTTETAEQTTVNPCQNNQSFDGNACSCQPPLTGLHCENGPRDCQDLPSAEGWDYVYPEDGKGKIRVFCWYGYLYAFAAPDGGLTSAYLNRAWNSYKTGFGDILLNGYTSADGGYWLGNDNIHRLTQSQTHSYKLNYFVHIPPKPNIGTKEGDYLNFVLDDEANNYTIHYKSFQTTQNIDQTLQSDRPFRAFDRNDDGCAAARKVGFWFDDTCSPDVPLFGFIKISGVNTQYTEYWGSIIRM